MSASLLMCSPEGFAVNYEINPWMRKQVGHVDRTMAVRQWQRLFDTLSQRTQVWVIPADPAWPDLVFTANAGLPLWGQRRFVLSNFRHVERQGEKALNRAWFEAQGWECVELPDGVRFEGAGDALADSQGRLWLGYGFRSEAAVAKYLGTHWPGAIKQLHLADPAYYHLDTCFCPLSDGSAVYLPEAFDSCSRDLLIETFGKNLIALTSDEGRLFCANAVEVDGQVVMNQITPRLRKILEDRGYSVATVALSEFIKSGGSAKCLTLRLDT